MTAINCFNSFEKLNFEEELDFNLHLDFFSKFPVNFEDFPLIFFVNFDFRLTNFKRLFIDPNLVLAIY